MIFFNNYWTGGPAPSFCRGGGGLGGYQYSISGKISCKNKLISGKEIKNSLRKPLPGQEIHGNFGISKVGTLKFRFWVMKFILLIMRSYDGLWERKRDLDLGGTDGKAWKIRNFLRLEKSRNFSNTKIL